jgi:hypothetical protein
VCQIDQMKRILAIETDNIEKLHTENPQISYTETKEIVQMTFEIVGHIIVFFCGVIEKHALRFVCKQFHKISHSSGSNQNDFFFFDSRSEAKFRQRRIFDSSGTKISIFGLATSQGHLKIEGFALEASRAKPSILKWFNQCFPKIFDSEKQRCCELAAKTGHLEILEWTRKNNFPWGNKMCAYAASSGQLKILRWIRENHGCPWDKETCVRAAEGGHLEILKRYAQR